MAKKKSIPFLKMQGLGNDFIVLDEMTQSLGLSDPFPVLLAQQLCDRRFGVGADQILRLRSPHGKNADARMEIVNADGSAAEMCGNGIRAVALYLRRYGPSSRRQEYRVETLAGIKIVQLVGESDVLVNMGAPVLGPGVSQGGEELEVFGEKFRFFEVSMGNPHAVFFVDDVAKFAVERFGPVIEKHSRFPKRTNVEFVQIVNDSQLQVRVWERGAGITLACGTGACASAVAALASGRVTGKVAVHLPGGLLQIGWKGTGQPVLMEGPAREVFRGEYFGESIDHESGS